MKHRRFPLSTIATRLVTGAFATLLALAPLGARAADPFEINAILAVTGPAAFLGKAQITALGLIEDQVNKKGGINGRPIKFVISDDQSSPQVAVQLFNAVTAKKVSVILGSTISSLCNAMTSLATDGPVIYCLSPAIHPPAGSYAFSSETSTTDQLAASAKYFRARGWRKVALITSSDATGQDAERGIDATFLQNGIDIVTREHFNIADVSVAAQLTHIKASGAQAMIAWTTGTPIATILRGMRDAGIDLPVEVSSGNVTFAQMHAYADFMPKEILFATLPAIVADQLPNGPIKARSLEYIDAFHAIGTRPDVGYISAWDPTLIVLDAYKKLGFNATAVQMRDYIANLHGFAGIDGNYDFRKIPQRGLDIDSAIMVRWDGVKDNWIAVSKYGGEPLK